MKNKKRKLNVLGVCAGAGVALYPFMGSKYFRVIGNVEPRSVFYTKDDEHWKANFEGVPMVRSLNELKPRRVDVLIGHPDCGDSSILRMSRAKKSGQPGENHSILLFRQALKKLRPKVFLMENLPGLLKAFPIEKWQELLPEYLISSLIAPVTLWGNSQESRKRLVMVGVLKSSGPKTLLFSLPDWPEPGKYPVYPAEHFELPETENVELGHVREPMEKLCNLYYGDKRQVTYREAKEIWTNELPNSSRWPVGGKMKNQPGVSKHIEGQPPYTVRKQNRQFSSSGLVLSPREMANIQGLPVSYKLIIKKSNSIYWINKMRVAVTKTMPMEIASWLKREITKQHQKWKDK